MSKQLISITVVLCALFGFSQAKAQVACGDRITTSEVLTSNLICTAENPALTIEGPNGSLNMRGFTLSCAGGGTNQEGIALTGEGALLENGTVTACGDGVVLRGNNHRVQRMVLQANDDIGVWTDTSSANSGHRISRNTARENNFGFIIISGSGHVVSGNQATNNLRNGFVGSGGTYTGNTATGNGIGIGDAGFQFGPDATASLNVARGNSGDGFLVDDDDNRLTANIARNNLDDGIDVRGIADGANNNRLTLNVASGNGSADFEGNGGFDLEDDNPNCDNNIWRFNVGTRNQNCIR